MQVLMMPKRIHLTMIVTIKKGGEKNGYFRNQEHNLNLSMNSKTKGGEKDE